MCLFLIIFYIYNTYNIRQRKRKTNDIRQDDQRGCRRKNESAEAEQQLRRRSREVATKMTYSEELWQATRTISTARCRHHDEVCRRRSVDENRCTERAKAVSRPRSYDRTHCYTIHYVQWRISVGRAQSATTIFPQK